MRARHHQKRFSFTALSMIWRIPGIERLSIADMVPAVKFSPRKVKRNLRCETSAGRQSAIRVGAVVLIFVAVDIGGTFTDLIGFDDETQTFVQAKSLTTPAQLAQGIIDCLRESGIEAGRIDELIHGSTIAINTLIERKGAKTGLVVTRGTRDVYIIGRGNRPESYNLFFHRHRPLVSRRHHPRGRRAAAGQRRGACSR